jgi:hypothetical protein
VNVFHPTTVFRNVFGKTLGPTIGHAAGEGNLAFPHLYLDVGGVDTRILLEALGNVVAYAIV